MYDFVSNRLPITILLRWQKRPFVYLVVIIPIMSGVVKLRQYFFFFFLLSKSWSALFRWTSEERDNTSHSSSPTGTALTSGSRSWCSQAPAGHVPSSAGNHLHCRLHLILETERERKLFSEHLLNSQQSNRRMKSTLFQQINIYFYSFSAILTACWWSSKLQTKQTNKQKHK